MLVATAVLAVFAGGITGDPSMKSGIDMTTEAYRQYKDFVEHFGNEEFILVALKQDREAFDPEVLKTLLVTTGKLKGLDNVTEVVSLSNIRVFSRTQGAFRNLSCGGHAGWNSGPAGKGGVGQYPKSVASYRFPCVSGSQDGRVPRSVRMRRTDLRSL